MRNLLSALMCCWLLACAGAGPGDERGPGGPASAESPADAGPADAGPVDSQASYTYPGCANEDYNCPRLRTAYCALEAIRQKHDGSCARVEDCTLAALENDCTGSSSCGGLPIHVAGAAAFRAEAQAEVDRYCGASPTCRASGSCAPAEVACKSGRCVWALVTGEPGP